MMATVTIPQMGLVFQGSVEAMEKLYKAVALSLCSVTFQRIP